MPLVDLTAAAIDGNEPQRTNNCLLYLDLTSTTPAVSGVTQSVLLMALESFPLPKSSLNAIELNRLNETRKFAGKPSFPEMSVVYKDFVSVDVYNNLNLWYKTVYDPITGQIHYKSAYAANGYVIMYPPDGTQTQSGQVRQYNLIGCWPSELDHGDADMGSDENVRISVTIQIDKIVPGVYGTPSLTGT